VPSGAPGAPPADEPAWPQAVRNALKGPAQEARIDKALSDAGIEGNRSSCYEVREGADLSCPDGNLYRTRHTVDHGDGTSDTWYTDWSCYRPDYSRCN